MRRKTLAELPEQWAPAQAEGRRDKTFQLRLITPMFGGDVESWKLNLKAPIRTQSVKGHLRFWWRTMQSEASHQELLYRENRIWGGKTDGGTSRGRSEISIAIAEQRVQKKSLADMENNYAVRGNVMPKYVLFPITQTVKDGGEVHFIEELDFALKVTYPPVFENEVLNTLRLWVLFGGVGARTRRGCGSLFCQDLLQPIQNEEALRTFLKPWMGSEAKMDAPYPQLRGGRLALGQASGKSAAEDWRGLLERYGDYRQGPGTGRAPGRRPGRSYWPEPDSIRRVTGENAPEHTPEHPDQIWFPRAAFGLPILTRFITQGDPGGSKDFTLQPDIGSGDRWPSPIILKALSLGDGTWRRASLRLNQSIPNQLALVGPRGFRHRLTQNEMPLATNGRIMLKHGRSLQPGDTPYEHLMLRHLELEELK